MAKKKPVPKLRALRKLQGPLIVYETQTKLTGVKRPFATVRLTDGLLYDVFIDPAEMVLSLERHGYATRLVDLASLVRTMFHAEEPS